MRLCWGLLLLLGCRSALAAPPPGSGGHDDQPTTAVPGCGHTVLIACPNVTEVTVKFHLFKDHQVICNYSCDLEQDGQRCEPRSSCSDVKPHVSGEGKFSGFMVTPSKTPVTYRCEATVKFPPPLKNIPGDPVVLVSVEGPQCGGQRCRSTDDHDNADSGHTRIWIWIVAVALLSIYSLAVTIMARIFWVKLRRTEFQNDYINTKPQVRRAKKKKGIQNPLPPRF